MNEWKESDWFQNWMILARQGQNAKRRAEGFAEVPVPERQVTTQTEASEPVPDAEWQVTE